MAMAILLAGLVGGITAETQNTVGGVGANHWVLTHGSGGRLAAVGVFPQSDEAAIASSPGVTRADSLVVLPQEIVHAGAKTSTVNVFGVTVGGLGSPRVTSGQPLSGSGQVVANTNAGVSVGEHIEIGTSAFRVVGLVTGRTLLAGTAMVYITVHDAQSLGFGGRPLITAVAISGNPATVPAGLQVFSTAVIEQRTIDALSNAVSSIQNSKVLMYIVAVIIIAALLYVSALQRVRDFAVLKALGSSTAALLASLAMQAVIVSLLAAAFACIICNFMGGIFQQQVAIPTSAYYTLPIAAIIVGLISSLVALRQATGADPAAAFG